MLVSLLGVPKQGKKQSKATRLTSNMCNEQRGQKHGWRTAIHDEERRSTVRVQGPGPRSKARMYIGATSTCNPMRPAQTELETGLEREELVLGAMG